MAFGDNLLALLEEKNISQKEFAQTLNIATTTLNGYIKNKRQPDFELVKKIAFILNVSTDYLLDYRRNGFELSAKELSLISKMRKLSSEQQDMIYDIVNLSVKRTENKE